MKTCVVFAERFRCEEVKAMKELTKRKKKKKNIYESVKFALIKINK